MIPLPDGINEQDVHQWLSHGWCLVDVGEMKPARFIRSYGSLVDVHIPNGDGLEELNVHTVVSSNLYAHWPECGSLNLPDSEFAVFLERRPIRGYCRTYNEDSLAIRYVRGWDLARDHGPDALSLSPMSEEVALAAFHPQYHSYSDAMIMLDGNWFSVAINPKVILVGNSNEHFVYFDGRLCGIIKEGRLSPICSDAELPRRMLKYFQQEVRCA